MSATIQPHQRPSTTESAVAGIPEILPLDEHNRALLANVHPPDWINPEPSSRYNLVVIGAGSGGLVSAFGAAGLGAKVALVEKYLLGGDCLNVGCVPSKALIRAARALADARDAERFGVHLSGEASVDFPVVMERMRRLRARISPNDSAHRLRTAGVDVFLGAAHFTGPDTVEVDGRVLRFSRAIVAAGARPAVPPVPGLSDAGYLTNENVFWLTRLPRRLAVIGGGPIGCELSQTFARFGSQVHLLQSYQQILEREDRDAAAIVEKALRRDGVEIATECRITAAGAEGDEKVLLLESGQGPSELRVDQILICVGRQPNTDGLDLEAAGVAYDSPTGIVVDDHLRTSNKRVYAVGDIASKYKFTHLSDSLARIAIQNALFFGRARARALTIPWCTYTDPEIAHVGLYEHEARGKGIDVRMIELPLADVDRAILDGEEEGFLRVLVNGKSDRIVGATLVARHAGEMISEITLAMTAGAGLKALARTIHPYPTQAEILRKAGDAFNRTRLTPSVKGLFTRLMRWRR